MAIYKRGNVWWIDVRVGRGLRRVRKSTGLTDETKARIVEQAAVAVNRGVTTRAKARAIIDAVTPDEETGVALDAVGAWYAARCEAEGVTLSRLEMQKRMSAVGKAVAWLADNTRARNAEDVTDEAAWQFATWYARERQCTVQTRNNLVGHLRAVWEMLIKHGAAKTNPWTRARGVRNASEETHGRAFTPDEIARILAAARDAGREWEGVVTVALYTGLRKRDVETLRWRGDERACIVADMEAGMVRGTPSKTSRKQVRVSIPMHAEARRALEAARSDAADGAEYVFPWRASRGNDVHAERGDTFADILRAAGIEEREGEHITFHSLRHTFVTRLAEAGVAQDVRMRLAGHTCAATSDRYTHADGAARAAIEAI